MGRYSDSEGNSRKPRVAVVGDFMEDVYWIGEARSLSAEVPIPVVKINEKKKFPGGAGNVAANLQALGIDALWFPGGGTPRKNRLMVGDHQLARWDEFDECTPVYNLQRMVGIDAIVVADYGKGSVDDYTIEAIKRHQSDVAAIPIFVDTKRDPSVWSGVATAIFPNSKEFQQFSGAYYKYDGLICWKQGDQGLRLYRDTVSIAASPAAARQVRSVNGAGDTVLAAFVYRWLMDMDTYAYHEEGLDYEGLLDFANTAAAIAVEHPFTYAPTLAEVEARFYRNE